MISLSTDTLASALTPTQVNTLESTQAMEMLESLLKNPMNCSVPCFFGIIPGKTHVDEVRNLFSRLGFSYREGKDFYNEDESFYSTGYGSENSGNGFSAVFDYSGTFVDNINVTPYITRQTDENSPRSWIAYSPETLIKRYGTPMDVEFGVDWQQSISIAMVMYFSSPDLSVLYEGYDMDNFRFCPLTAPFDYVNVLIGPTPKLLSMDRTVSLEKATSLTLDQFAQLMLGDPKKACFSISQKPWLSDDE
jgi:hypothetical protein